MNEKITRGGAVVAASYLKRWLEKRYDTLMDSPTGERLKQLDPKSKYGIEAALYVLTAVLDQKLDDSTPMKALVKNVAMDAGPEMAKRMLNGDSMGVQATEEPYYVAGRDILLETMIGLPETDLSELLEWLASYRPQQRKVIIGRLRSLSADQLHRLLLIGRDERAHMVQVLLGLGESPVTAAIADGLDSITNQVRSLRARSNCGEGKE